MAKSTKYVYFFGDGKADGDGSMKELLGGKGANLAEMAGHPFMVGSQFHPEFKSRPLKPHPLFRAFVGAANERRMNRRRGAARSEAEGATEELGAKVVEETA